MANTVRKTAKRSELDSLWQSYASLMFVLCFSVVGNPTIGNGTTNGRLRTTVSTVGRIMGVAEVTKASTDDLWNLSGETAVPAATYRAYWLYLNSAGTASFVAGTNAASIAAALAALPSHDETKTIFGVYVAGPSTNFANALVAQGTVYNGVPPGANIGVPGKTFVVPTRLDLIAP